jgi:hypothetical protein
MMTIVTTIMSCFVLFVIVPSSFIISVSATTTPIDSSPLYLPSSLKQPAWMDFTPSVIIAGEDVQFQFKGFIFQAYKMTAKISANSTSCEGLAPGCTPVALDSNSRATLTVNATGNYSMCLTHNNIVWEQVMRQVTVRGMPMMTSNPSEVLFGYYSCAQLVKLNNTWCGCYYGTNQTAGNAVTYATMSMDFPLSSLVYLPNDTMTTIPPPISPMIIQQGCCSIATPITRTYSIVPTPQIWGVCSLLD